MTVVSLSKPDWECGEVVQAVFLFFRLGLPPPQGAQRLAILPCLHLHHVHVVPTAAVGKRGFSKTENELKSSPIKTLAHFGKTGDC
jgi:hypothetical protein